MMLALFSKSSALRAKPVATVGCSMIMAIVCTPSVLGAVSHDIPKSPQPPTTSFPGSESSDSGAKQYNRCYLERFTRWFGTFKTRDAERQRAALEAAEKYAKWFRNSEPKSGSLDFPYSKGTMEAYRIFTKTQLDILVAACKDDRQMSSRFLQLIMLYYKCNQYAQMSLPGLLKETSSPSSGGDSVDLYYLEKFTRWMQKFFDAQCDVYEQVGIMHEAKDYTKALRDLAEDRKGRCPIERMIKISRLQNPRYSDDTVPAYKCIWNYKVTEQMSNLKLNASQKAMFEELGHLLTESTIYVWKILREPASCLDFEVDLPLPSEEK